ncbi:hypothetical protein E2C01_079249 [Portunus trituberculatus]|uniref:Uncharacterized protein n=1 Tax=Portunus trituberculatus TaxID=210409 RepID=A0A5B7IJ39_PORTR|nr:hypothetical protein [Portunus trituberculatus]
MNMDVIPDHYRLAACVSRRARVKQGQGTSSGCRETGVEQFSSTSTFHRRHGHLPLLQVTPEKRRETHIASNERKDHKLLEACKQTANCSGTKRRQGTGNNGGRRVCGLFLLSPALFMMHRYQSHAGDGESQGEPQVPK